MQGTSAPNPGPDPEIPDARASGFILPIPAKSGFPISRPTGIRGFRGLPGALEWSRLGTRFFLADDDAAVVSPAPHKRRPGHGPAHPV
jgi:hypothetical protein